MKAASDVFQLKCIPGSEQECPEGFGGGDTENCLSRDGGCPEGYHGEEDDETGQCYPNSEGCNTTTIMGDGTRIPYILLTDRPDGKPNNCEAPRFICDEEEARDLLECKKYIEAVNRN